MLSQRNEGLGTLVCCVQQDKKDKIQQMMKIFEGGHRSSIHLPLSLLRFFTFVSNLHSAYLKHYQTIRLTCLPLSLY